MHKFDVVVNDTKTSEANATSLTSLVLLIAGFASRNVTWPLRYGDNGDFKARTTTIVIGALGTFSNNLQKYLENLRIGLGTQTLQT